MVHTKASWIVSCGDRMQATDKHTIHLDSMNSRIQLNLLFADDGFAIPAHTFMVCGRVRGKQVQQGLV